MTLAQVVKQVLAVHPDLALGRIDTAIASSDRQSTEGLLDPVVTASVGASEDKTPVANSFQASKTQQGSISAGISKPLASGATISASAAFNSSKQSFSNPVAASFSLINPEYRNQFDVSYRHPLLKGGGRPDYHYALLAADAGTQSAMWQQQVIARSLALQALNLYYQLASDEINIRIARDAVKRAQQLLSYQHSREKFGLIEASDRLQTEALVAARETALQQARVRHASDLSQLNRLMQRPLNQAIKPSVGGNVPHRMPSFGQAVETSREKRPEFAALKARLQAAEAQLAIASDQDQMQVDLVAQLGTRSLDGNIAAALRKSTSIHDRFASLSVEVSDVLNRNSAHAAIRKAELARERVLAEQTQLLEQVRDDLANAITAIQTGMPSLQAAEKQVAIEKKKFRAESKRYKEGRSDTATIVQFEGDLSRAELQVEIERIKLQLAEKQLIWAQGQLLDQLGVAIQAKDNPS